MSTETIGQRDAAIVARLEGYKTERRMLRPEESFMLVDELQEYVRIGVHGSNELDQRNTFRGLHHVLAAQGIPVFHIDGRDHTTPADVTLSALGQAIEQNGVVLWSHLQDLVIPSRTPRDLFSPARSHLLLDGLGEVPHDYRLVVSTVPNAMLRDYKADEELVRHMYKSLGEVHVHNVWPATVERQFFGGREVPPGAIIHALDYPNTGLDPTPNIPSVSSYPTPLANHRRW